MNEFSGPIDAFLTYLRASEQRYRMEEANEQEANGLTNDIHHELELVEHSEGEVLALGLELAEVRRKRRKAKDVMSATAPVLEFLDENRSFVKRLEQLLGDVRKAERRVEGRIYTPRFRLEKKEGGPGDAE